MKQVQMAEYGAADVLKIVEVPVPMPKQGEILVKVSAIGVNYSDILRRKNTYFMPTPLPYVPGAEAVGEVVETGDGVDHLKKGDKVLAILPAGGGYAEYLVANAAYCVPLPPHIDDRIATALFVQGTTAHLLVSHVAGGLKDKTVLVHAASGGVGSLLVQLAKMDGARVIAAASTDEKLALAKTAGADVLVNYSLPDWTRTLIEKNAGEKVDYIFEMSGGKIYEACIDALKPGGTIIVYGAAGGEKGFIHSERFVDENQQLLSFNLAHFIQHHPDLWQASLGTMVRLVLSGQIKVSTSNAFPLADAKRAHEAIEARKTTGKVVLFN